MKIINLVRRKSKSVISEKKKMLYQPNAVGYAIFTEYIHQNKFTGLIHAIAMPIATSSLVLIIYSIMALYKGVLNGLLYTTYVTYFILGGYASGYATYDPIFGFITICFYGLIPMNFTLQYINYYGNPFNIKKYLRIGVMGMLISVLCMEFIGHWYLEGAGSDVSQLFNSIYQTPLYGIRSLIFNIIK